LGRASIEADVQSGSADAARLEAAKANQTHGLRRTNEDKRKSVEMVLRDENAAENWTDREIAKHCGVSHPFVAAIRDPQIAAKQKANSELHAFKKSQSLTDGAVPQQSNSQKVELNSTPTTNVVIEPAPKPTPAPEPEREQVADVVAPDIMDAWQDDAPSAEEMALLAAEQLKDQKLIEQMLDSDDALAFVTNELAMARAQLNAMKASRDGLNNKCNSLIETIKTNQRKIDRLEKLVKVQV
jgi:hypothetical protein